MIQPQAEPQAAPQFKFKLSGPEVDMALYALQSAPGGPYSSNQLMALVNKLVGQGRPQLEALAVKTDEDPEHFKPGGTD